jgi:DNA repair protein NreA
MNIPCIKCKGRNPANCGRTFCPITAKAQSIVKVKENVKSDFYGSSPAPFVGRFGYPNINVGVLSPTQQREDAWMFDAPKFWADNNIQIMSIVDFRSSLVNSQFKANVKQQSKMLSISQEVGMASKPVDLEINLKDKPKFRVNSDSFMAPTGPNAQLKKAMITSNSKIDSKVDKVVSDTDLKSSLALDYLYKKGFDENFLSKLLSVGTLGIKNNRKLVPTRWSITATDDTLGKRLIKDVKDFSECNYLAYFGGYLGNYFLVLFVSDVWSYELFETYMPGAEFNVSDKVQYSTDHEFYAGRKQYAFETAGGYYASRLPVLEKLKQIKRQSSVLVLRFITGEYGIPLGVWVVREAMRKAMKSIPVEFASRELMLKYAKNVISKKFGFNLDILVKESKVLKQVKQQKKLFEYH